MNREILFRGFHEDENGKETIILNNKKVRGEWIEGMLCRTLADRKLENGYGIQVFDVFETEYLDVIPETVGQYTGKEDENKRKIFENDYVKITYTDDGKVVCGIVKYTEFGFICSWIDDVTGCEVGTSLDIRNPLVEVIGNIFSNPELLEANNG